MKVLVLSNKAPFPANDGSSIAIANLALGLADNGIDLHLLTINTKKHFKADEKIDTFIKEKTHYQSIYKDTNPTVFGAFLNLFSRHSYFVSRFYFSEFERALIQLLKTQSFDIIQLEGVFMASYIPILKKYSKSKITLRAHNVEHQIWDRLLLQEKSFIKKAYLSLQNKRLKKFELQAFDKCDAIVTITDIDKQTIKSLMPSQNIETCLTGLNLINYVPIFSPIKTNTVFHFASMDWMPNVEAVDWLLKHVWNEVIKEVPDAKLILAGRGMPETIKQKGSTSVTVIEEVESSSEFYNTYDIMLVPLWSGSGLRIKLVEGLAYGKAIITTSIGAEGIPYVANKHLMIADNHAEFIRAIILLLKDEQTKQALQQEARHLAEKEFDYIPKKPPNKQITILSIKN
jgi:glycosyltransferase involved in cell wall biosynthesis